mmetsp:Transcript_4376/g.17735  ORF Transcript_4376/g.17735 Transcript_4376/m.17735 type:complete len:200 (+) Transcript_4376:295-894(+)
MLGRLDLDPQRADGEGVRAVVLWRGVALGGRGPSRVRIVRGDELGRDGAHRGVRRERRDLGGGERGPVAERERADVVVPRVHVEQVLRFAAVDAQPHELLGGDVVARLVAVRHAEPPLSRGEIVMLVVDEGPQLVGRRVVLHGAATPHRLPLLDLARDGRRAVRRRVQREALRGGDLVVAAPRERAHLFERRSFRGAPP